MQLVIPMAGAGSRFSEAGYRVPKPLLELDGKPMYQRVFENLFSTQVNRVVFITNTNTAFDMRKIQIENPDVEFHQKTIDFLTDGPARTVSLVEHLLDSKRPLIIGNSDQLVAYPISNDYSLLNSGYGGIIWCMEDHDPKWSYVRTSEDLLVEHVVEKEVISNLATVGIYCFGKSELFFEAFRSMVLDGNATNGEFYVAPAFNYLPRKERVLAKNLGPISNLVFGLGIPEDYEYFLKLTNREEIYKNSQSG
jgi:dTDP-glucose pyrophosphorylase